MFVYKHVSIETFLRHLRRRMKGIAQRGSFGKIEVASTGKVSRLAGRVDVGRGLL